MAKKAKKPEEPAGESAPMWIVSFADLVTLMMSFFVVLYALKQGGPQQQLETAAAIKKQFGYVPPDDSSDPLDMEVMSLMGRPKPPMSLDKGRSEMPPKGAQGDDPEVTTIRAGKDITSGGAILFDTGSAALNDQAKIIIGKLADLVRGHNNVLVVKGHVSPDEISLRPEDPNGMGLSYQRATVVADALVKLGIERTVLRPYPCGPFEPIKVQVYDSAGQRPNRRVELYSTDLVATDFVPSTLVTVPSHQAASSPATNKTLTDKPTESPH